jgi:8-oxo-dGTP pyrophosphatase MutT (NUDIX family)
MIDYFSQNINSISELEDWELTASTRFHLSAVLIPVVLKDEQPHIILTRRSRHLNHHPGQISFPGGRAESGDKNAVDTALRETHEEIGIPREQIVVTGFIDEYTTVSNFIITPVVGIINSDYQTRIDPVEVDYIFEAPCEILLNASNYQQNEIEWQGEKRLFWEVDYKGHHIWGATAAILRNMALRLTNITP